jgi:hypothetical protein
VTGTKVYPACDRPATANRQAHGHVGHRVHLRAGGSDVDRISVGPSRISTRSDLAQTRATIGVGPTDDRLDRLDDG